MNMLRIILAVLLFGCSCSSETKETVNLKVSQKSLSFAVDGGTAKFNITAGNVPRVQSRASWCTIVAVANTVDNEYMVTVAAAENSGEARQTELSVVCDGQSNVVKVVQDGVQIPEVEEPADDSDKVFLGVDIPQRADTAPWQIAEKLGIGFNLGNQMDANNNGYADETCWGNSRATQTTFNKIKEAGFSSVRIPVTWLGHIGPAPEYEIDEAWLSRVVELVGYAEKAGLNAIVNMHHDGADSAHWLDIKNAALDPELHQTIIEQIEAMWTQIAEAMQDFGDFLILESFNEIQDGGWGWGQNLQDGGQQYKCLNEWNGAFVNAVRAVGGNNATRYLGISGYSANPNLTINHLQLPSGVPSENLLISVHCYDPYTYTLEAKHSEWGYTAMTSKKPSGDNEKDLLNVFKALYDRFISNGIPVYMGEFGCVNRYTEREQQYQRYYLKYYAKLAKKFGIPPFIWDNGARGAGKEKHAFIDHGTGEYCSDEAKAAIEALIDSYENDHTLGKIYRNAPYNN